MYRKILLASVISLLCIQIYSQSDTKLFYFGAGVGFGFFYPENINNSLNDHYNYATSYGVYDMFMYYVLNTKGSFFFTKYTELQLEGEWAFSPKIIVINDKIDTYFYRRLTPAVKLNIHIPTSDKFSIYFGPGINWNSLRFNTPLGSDYNGNCLGFSGQAGVMVRFSKWAIEPFITVNIINAEIAGDGSNMAIENLNFTGVQIGNTFFF